MIVGVDIMPTHCSMRSELAGRDRRDDVVERFNSSLFNLALLTCPVSQAPTYSS